MPKKKTLIRNIVESKTFECFLIKRIISAVIGFTVGYAYYAISFSRAFRQDEQEYADMVKWGVLLASTIGCFISPQCCCIAALCVPTISAKTGRNLIQATLLAWILSGPITNILYHATEAIRCISCVAELQDNQSKLMIDLMKAPIVHGLGLIVDESNSLEDSQHELEDNMKELQSELLISAFGEEKAKEMMIEEDKVAEEKKIKEEEEKKKKVIEERERKKEEKRKKKKEEERRRKEEEEKRKQLKKGGKGSRWRLKREVDVVRSLTQSHRVKRQVDDEEYLPDALEEEYLNETEPVIGSDVDLAGNMRKDAHYACDQIYDSAYNACCKLANETWSKCMNIVVIPQYSYVICQIVYWIAEGLCKIKIKNKRDPQCDNEPNIDNVGINNDYGFVTYQVKNVDKQFYKKMRWKMPFIDEKAAIMTVQEITRGVKSDYKWRMTVMSVFVSIAKKLVAVTVILVLKAAAGYNSNYLTNYTFDNFYVSSYFAYKDRQRKLMKKRHLLPLTKIESKYVLRPTDFKFTAAEKKSILFKLITIFLQGLFTTILFLLDEMVFFVMDLIARHGKADFRVTGRHMLEADIKGNGTVSDLMRIVFSGFLDNEHEMEMTGSNEECMPEPHQMDREVLTWSIAGYVFLVCLIFMEGYLLRFRRVICGIFYPKREKKRIIHLYNDLLRQRKQYIFSVRKTVLKLALTKRLNQKYSFLEAIRIRYPKVGKIISMCGCGRLKCLICETPETPKHTLWRCSNARCRMLYCNICWIEVNELCWACNSYRGVEKALSETEGNVQPAQIMEEIQEILEPEQENLLKSDDDASETSL